MRLTSLALVLALAGLGGSVAAARPAKKASASKVQKASKKNRSQKVRKAPKARPAPRTARKPMVHMEAPAPPRDLSRLAPLAALPELPGSRPKALTHLEGIFPAEPRPAVPEGALPQTPGQLAASIQPVLGGQEPLPGQVPEAPLSFAALDLTHLDLLWPVETRTVSSAWGPRMRSRTVRVRRVSTRSAKARRKLVRVRYQGSHKGVDLNAPKGSDIYAALDGVVITSVRHPQYGNYVVLDHGSGVVTLYAHNRVNFVKEGDVVKRGQKIAEVGATGHATGPHLHFELRVDGGHRNPLPFLNEVEEVDAELAAQNELLQGPPEPPAPVQPARRRRR